MSTARPLTVRVPATTANLGPGFDAFGAAVSLYLTARAVPRDGGDPRSAGPRVTTLGEGAGEVPQGADNLVWRALVGLCEAHEVPVPEVSLEVDNDIPLERGLGSSSAAIVAGLCLGRSLVGLPVADPDLARLGADIEGHPDNVVPALLGGLTCTARKDDGGLVVRRAQPHSRLRPVLLVPVARQATGAARDALPAALTRDAVALQVGRAGHVLVALAGGWPVEPAVAGDVLHEPPRLEVMPATEAVIGALRGAGLHAWLSGAGPAVAVAVAAGDERALDRCRRVADGHGFTPRALDWDLAGAMVAR